jgi:hypothetical protein
MTMESRSREASWAVTNRGVPGLVVRMYRWEAAIAMANQLARRTHERSSVRKGR